MRYKSGQFSRGSIALDDYRTKIIKETITLTNKTDTNIPVLNESNFDGAIATANNHYYLQFKASKVTENTTLDWDFQIKITNTAGTSQILRTLRLSSTNVETVYELVFTPLVSIAEMTFELIPNNEDTTIGARQMTIEILEFSQLTNILTVEGKFLAQALSNMEVQGPSGLLMCINGEEIRVGRTGIYSINHKSININSLGFVLKPTNLTSDGFEFFVINYQYEEV